MLLPNLDYELSLIPQNTRYLLGIDEVGWGPLAGPVTIGAFLIDLETFSPHKFTNLKVRDSKKLSPIQRQKIHKYFSQNNYIFKTFSASSAEIDQQGISVSIISLISKALKYFGSTFDFCLIDGNYNVDNFIRLFPRSSRGVSARGIQGVLSVIKGDVQCFSIAAASIVAKVDRDAQMDNFHTQYPQYGFNLHRGYGTKKHLEALKQFGPSPIHRLSFNPLKCISATLP